MLHKNEKLKKKEVKERVKVTCSLTFFSLPYSQVIFTSFKSSAFCFRGMF